MAEDQPTLGELARGIADIKLMLISRDRYESDQQGVRYRLDELVRDLEDERRERGEAVKAVSERLAEQARSGLEHRRHWRELLWQGALPALATIVGVIAAIWIAYSGGH